MDASLLQLTFWLLLLIGLYPYVVYPIVVGLLGKLVNRRILKGMTLPHVTVITAAFNEQAHIEATVRNKLSQQYPADKLDVIVVSDCSSDGTDQLVQAIAAQESRVRLLRNELRSGKTVALNAAVPQATGEIVVFADANSIYRPDAIAQLVKNFSDPSVGYVTGRMLYVDANGSLVGDGCSAYMKYENALRAAETRLGSIVGVDGGVDAIRRQLYRPMLADQLPDFVLPLSVVAQGYRVVYEPDAVLTEETLVAQSQEYRMRVRVALRAFWALWDKRELLNPWRAGLFSWQLWSHKLLRYMSFLPLLIAMILNWYLLSVAQIYQIAAVGQIVFVALTLVAAISNGWLAKLSLSRYCFYFFLLNWASAVAFGKFMRGHKQVLWQPRTG